MKTLKAPGKVNLGLKITGRKDGYHLLDMIMAPIDLFDEITIEPIDSQKDEIFCNQSIPPVNTVSKTLEALRREGLKNHYRIRISSCIPQQAGLGAASSQAASVLKALTETEKLNLDDQKLNEIAFSIGADVPFFLKAVPSRVGSKGEQVFPFAMNPFSALLIKPDFGISTGLCFKQSDQYELDDKGKEKMDRIQDLLEKGDPLQAAREIENDLYPPAAELAPKLAEIAEKIRRSKAEAVFMSGSGSSVIALFENPQDLYSAKEHLTQLYPDYFIREVKIG